MTMLRIRITLPNNISGLRAVLTIIKLTIASDMMSYTDNENFTMLVAVITLSSKVVAASDWG